MNPHQVDAALFAFNSPLSKGALLADEVGLGKTIEDGLVVSQKWAYVKHAAKKFLRFWVVKSVSIKKKIGVPLCRVIRPDIV